MNGAKTKVPADGNFKISSSTKYQTLTDSGATNRDACGKASPPVKVVGDDYDGGNVAETQPTSGDDAEEEVEKVDVVGEGGGKEAHRCHHGSHYSDITAAVPDRFNVNIVGETARERALEDVILYPQMSFGTKLGRRPVTEPGCSWP